MTAHAKLSASGSHRWLGCPGSVKAEEGLSNTSSVFAQEGTAAHSLAELCLNTCDSPYDYVGKVLPSSDSHIIDTEMADNVQTYIDYVRSIQGITMIEQRVDFSPWVPKGFGTCDAMVIDGTTNTLHVIDLKYGKGHRVEAENNTQALSYALGAFHEYGLIYSIDHVVMTIVQPRLDSIDTWKIPRGDLMLWGERIKQGAELALSDDAPRIPGDSQCAWCKAKATCKALKDKTEAVIMSSFDNLDCPTPDTLDDDQLRLALESKKLITSWLDAVEAVVLDRLETGKGFPGFKMVEGRSNRAWVDEPMAESVLTKEVGDKAFVKKILSPAAAEKLLGKSKASLLNGLIIKPKGSPTLAQENDPRPSVGVTASDFD